MIRLHFNEETCLASPPAYYHINDMVTLCSEALQTAGKIREITPTTVTLDTSTANNCSSSTWNIDDIEWVIFNF